MKYIKRIFVIAFTCLLLISCKNSNNTDHKYTKFESQVENKKNIAYLDVSKEGENISYAILNKNGIVESGSTYHLKENSLEKFINIANYVNIDMEYNLLVFVNYKQVSYEVDGTKQDIFTSYIAQNSDIQIPIKIDDLHAGLNDIVFLIIPNPNKNLQNEVNNETLEDVLYLRCNAIVGENRVKNYVYDDLSSIDGSEIPVAIQAKENNDMADFNAYDLELNNVKDVYITVGNNMESKEEFAVILLDNWKQIPILGQDSIFIQLESNKSVQIPESIIYNTPGLHRIVAITIKNPYNFQDYRSMDVESSQWITINAINK